MKELWVITDDAQYRVQKKNNSNIQLTFWFSDGTIKHFNTNCSNLYKMLESADSSLYDTKSL